MFAIQNYDCRIADADESTELWQTPFSLLNIFPPYSYNVIRFQELMI